MKNILIYLTLRAHGWKRYTLEDGSRVWHKVVSPTCTRTGPTSYAIANLLR